MTSPIKKTVFRLFLGVLLFSFVVAACNSKKDKKEDTPKDDTTIVEPMPLPTIDTIAKDTADTRPVKPGDVDPVKPGD